VIWLNAESSGQGRATGIPTTLKELRENGAPEPKFLTDDDYTVSSPYPVTTQKEKCYFVPRKEWL